jgi:hypothetical protein
MKKRLRYLLGISLLITTIHALALTNPPSGQPKTFLGPALQLNRYDTFTESLGFAVLGEAGPRNFRAGGTLGWMATPHQRLKLSAEYLFQNLTYSFFSGNTNQWVSQAALGLAYQADIPCTQRYQTQFHMNGFLSHAPSKNLSNVTGTYFYNNVVTNYTNFRRIAGSNAAGISPGINFLPWEGGLVNLDANYDNVRYDTIYTQNQDAKGIGATISLNQLFIHHIDLNALASIRAPFNQFAGDVGWTTNSKLGQWRLSLGSDYVIGKNTLPSSYSLLLGANYVPSQPSPQGSQAKITAWRFIDWLAKPAIYLPQVLAIPDERVGNCLGAPTVIGQIGGSVFSGVGFIGAFSVALNTIFSGENITYTINYNGQPNNGSVIISSGTLIGNDDYPNDAYTNISVTATNACGSRTSNLFQAIKS